MNREIPEELIAYHSMGVILSSASQFDHRGMVLRHVCQLEYDVKLMLIEAFRLINPELSDSLPDVVNSPFGPDKTFGSLSRCIKILEMLNIIDRDLAMDFKGMVSLRNAYAHSKDRGQLEEDERSMKALYDMPLVINSLAISKARDVQAVFLAAVNTLKKTVADMIEEMRLKREQV